MGRQPYRLICDTLLKTGANASCKGGILILVLSKYWASTMMLSKVSFGVLNTVSFSQLAKAFTWSKSLIKLGRCVDLCILGLYHQSMGPVRFYFTWMPYLENLNHFFFYSSSDTPLKSTQPLPARAYNLAYAPSSSRLLVSMAHRHVYVYDVAKLAAATDKIPASQERESALKFMTRSIATMADGKGMNNSSINPLFF